MCIDNMFQVIFNQKKNSKAFQWGKNIFPERLKKSWKDILEGKEMLWIEMLKNIWKDLMSSTLSMLSQKSLWRLKWSLTPATVWGQGLPKTSHSFLCVAIESGSCNNF